MVNDADAVAPDETATDVGTKVILVAVGVRVTEPPTAALSISKVTLPDALPFAIIDVATLRETVDILL